MPQSTIYSIKTLSYIQCRLMNISVHPFSSVFSLMKPQKAYNKASFLDFRYFSFLLALKTRFAAAYLQNVLLKTHCASFIGLHIHWFTISHHVPTMFPPCPNHVPPCPSHVPTMSANINQTIANPVSEELVFSFNEACSLIN